MNEQQRTDRTEEGEKARYTAAEIVSMVDEMTSKGYDFLKRRILTAVEVITGTNGMAITPSGHLIAGIIDDAMQMMQRVAKERIPEITPELVELVRAERKERLDK